MKRRKNPTVEDRLRRLSGLFTSVVERFNERTGLRISSVDFSEYVSYPDLNIDSPHPVRTTITLNKFQVRDDNLRMDESVRLNESTYRKLGLPNRERNER